MESRREQAPPNPWAQSWPLIAVIAVVLTFVEARVRIHSEGTHDNSARQAEVQILWNALIDRLERVEAKVDRVLEESRRP